MVEIREIIGVDELNSFLDDTPEVIHVVLFDNDTEHAPNCIMENLENLSREKIGNTLVAVADMNKPENEPLKNERNFYLFPSVEFLKDTVKRIYAAILLTADFVERKYPQLDNYLPREIKFITTQELIDRYPTLTAKERENAIAKEYGAVFLMQIGGRLSNGEKHDGRAPDYDDWSLNGDLLVYNRVLDSALELSSMGIRVDKEALIKQLTAENKLDRLELPFHKSLVNGELPLTIGGGIGQSRLCMQILQKAHIGEVHASVWPEEEIKKCEELGIELL